MERAESTRLERSISGLGTEHVPAVQFAFDVDEDIVVRPFTPADAEVVYETTVHNRERLAPWMSWIDGVHSIADTHAFLVGCERAAREGVTFTGGIWEGKSLAGAVSLHDIDWQNKCSSIGYWLDEEHTRRGIMTRTVAALCRFAFTQLELHRLQIRVASQNTASRRIPERLGFTLEGVLREAQLVRGNYLDHALYALVRE